MYGARQAIIEAIKKQALHDKLIDPFQFQFKNLTVNFDAKRYSVFNLVTVKHLAFGAQVKLLKAPLACPVARSFFHFNRPSVCWGWYSRFVCLLYSCAKLKCKAQNQHFDKKISPSKGKLNDATCDCNK